jgi:hypothetical protein
VKTPVMRLLLCSIVGLLGLRAAARQPNILYILADDLGWADVSWHNKDMHTPVLEGLARRGVIMDR